MATMTFAKDVTASARIHREVLDQFAAIVRSHLSETQDAFARESLADLLDSIAEQRAGYDALVAVAGPTLKLAA